MATNTIKPFKVGDRFTGNGVMTIEDQAMIAAQLWLGEEKEKARRALTDHKFDRDELIGEIIKIMNSREVFRLLVYYFSGTEK